MTLVTRRLETETGPVEIVMDTTLGSEPAAVVVGELGAVPLVRFNSRCMYGEALGATGCECGAQLRDALARMRSDPQGGILVYLEQEGRGAGLLAKVQLGRPPDVRDYTDACRLLVAMGITKVRLLSGNPAKLAALGRSGIADERVTRQMGQVPPGHPDARKPVGWGEHPKDCDCGECP